MKIGFISNLELTETEIDDIVKSAHKNGFAYIPVITPKNQSSRLIFRTHRFKGFNRVEIDTFSSNWDITEAGRKAFFKLTEAYPEDIKEPAGSRCILSLYIKHDDKRMWGVGLWLVFMLEVLKKAENIKECEEMVSLEKAGFVLDKKMVAGSISG